MGTRLRINEFPLTKSEFNFKPLFGYTFCIIKIKPRLPCTLNRAECHTWARVNLAFQSKLCNVVQAGERKDGCIS